jgi:hypothetical protein
MNYLILIVFLISQISCDAVLTGDSSLGDNSLNLDTFDQIIGNPVDTPREWVSFARQYGREDDGYSANDGNTYRVGRTRVDVVVEPESMPDTYRTRQRQRRVVRPARRRAQTRVQSSSSGRRGTRVAQPRRNARFVSGGRQTVYVAR